MATVSERLYEILRNVRPSEVNFTVASKQKGRVIFRANETQPFHILPNQDPLQAALEAEKVIYQVWNDLLARYQVDITVSNLFNIIKSRVIVEYERTSSRSSATKRKTSIYIQSLDLNDTQSYFLVQTYIDINSAEWNKKSREEKQNLFETFESLRRMYGKQ